MVWIKPTIGFISTGFIDNSSDQALPVSSKDKPGSGSIL
jgi:hypothetical protein